MSTDHSRDHVAVQFEGSDEPTLFGHTRGVGVVAHAAGVILRVQFGRSVQTCEVPFEANDLLQYEGRSVWVNHHVVASVSVQR